MKNLLYTLFIGVFALGSFAQDQYTPGNPIPPTPNATAIQKYGNTDVSLYTGATNVSIPIFTAVDKDISLPVTLNYSGSGGIKVQEIASWVGIGWTLNAGGAVSRTINNRADDDDNGDGFTILGAIPPATAPNAQTFLEFGNGSKDGEPDVFYYNAGGISGKFVIKKDASIFQIPQTENQIIVYQGMAGSYTVYDGSDEITAFKIVDTNGMIYWFEAIESSRSRRAGSGSWTDTDFYASSWYLTKIENGNGTAAITLNYVANNYNQYPETVSNIYTTLNGFNHGYTITEIQGQRLSSISFPQGSINFKATQERCDLADDNYLEEIEIRDKNNALIKRFDFGYSYFDSNGTVALSTPCDQNVHVPGHSSLSDGDYNQRLKLDEIQEVGNDGVTSKPPYKFTYYSSHYLPSRYSFARDHWGYYNGQTSNGTLEPINTVQYKDPFGTNLLTQTFGSANRNASDAHMQAGILTAIEYPTGGQTSFEYESHEAENDDINFYVVQSSSSGSIAMQAQDTYSSTFSLSSNFGIEVAVTIKPFWTVSSTCKLELTIKDAGTNQIVHQETYEQSYPGNIIPDIELPAGSYQFKYKLVDLNGNCSQFGGDIATGLEWENRTYTKNISIGGLRIKSVKDYADAGSTLAMEKTYEYKNDLLSSGNLITVPRYGFYEFDYDDNKVLRWVRTYYSNTPLATTKGSHVGYSKVTEYVGTPTNNAGYTIYSFRSADEYPNETRGWTQTEYDDSYTHMGVTHYKWVFPRTNDQDWRRGQLIKKEVYTDNNVKVQEVENSYQHLTPSDVIVTGINPTSYSSSTTDDYVKGVVTDVSLNNGTITYVKFYKYWSGRVNLMSTITRNYDENGANVLSSTVDYSYENTAHRQVTKQVSTNSDGLSHEVRYKYPHDYSTPSTAITKLKERNQIAQVIEQHKLVDNEVTNASGMRFVYYSASDLLLLSNTYRFDTQNPTSTLPSSSNGDSFSDYTLDYTLSYNNDGLLTQVVGRGGVTTSYIWNSDDLPVAKGEGVTYANLLTAFNAAGGNETTLRNHSSVANGLITTYNYELLRGLTKITDYEGNAQTFNYDPHARLTSILDVDDKLVAKYEYNLVGSALSSSNRNYVKTTQYRSEGTLASPSTNTIVSFDYVDGLGRVDQRVQKAITPASKDLVAHIEFDTYGRMIKEFLPYPSSANSGTFKTNAAAEQSSYYLNDYQLTAYGYAEKRFEDSQLNRIKEQGSPGDDWRIGQNTVTFDYDHNGASEVKQWQYDGLQVSASDFYPANSLYKNTVTDEDGNPTIEFTDKQGRTILKKSLVSGSTWAETYYIYDNKDRLRYVLPPQSNDDVEGRLAEVNGYTNISSSQNVTGNGNYVYTSNATVTIPAGTTITSGHITPLEVLDTDFLADWAFQYDYDERDRMIMKQVPGADPVYMVYDKWDRLAATQDGNQRSNNQWLFTKYDELNRPIITGLNTDTRTRDQIQDALNASGYTARSESYNGSGTIKYTSTAYPTSSIDAYLTITYYDDYDFNGGSDYTSAGFSSGTYNIAPVPQYNVKGQVTGTLTDDGTGTAGSPSFLETITTYDNKYRPIQVVSENHVGSTASDRISNQYDFQGNIRRTRVVHTDGGSTNHTINRRFDYDHANRLTNTYHQVDSQAEVVIASNDYNELGELAEKDLHGGEQLVDYAYNIRGWLTSINNSSLSDGEGDLFGMELNYNINPIDGANTHFNGNIASMQWSDQVGAGTSNYRSYNYSYDGLNRLTAADHRTNGTNSNSFDVNNLQYDLNGNISTLRRRAESTGSYMDDMSYAYVGNQLLSVTDAGDDNIGFVDGNTSGNDYYYDANGNMIADANKGITNITYNHLNLPTRVNMGTNDYIDYQYDAAGIKLQQKVYEGGNLTKTTDYVGEFIYEDGALELIQHEEGRIIPKNGNFDYQYHLKDHLGNVRMTFSTTPESYTMVETFETGETNGWEDLHRFTNSNANTTTGGNEVERLQSGQTGAMLFLSLNKGDTVDLSVNANYESAPSNNTFVTTAYNTLFNAFDNVYGSGTEGGVTSTSSDFNSALGGSQMAGKSGSSTAPRAYLNYIIFDLEMNYVTAGYQQISTSAQGVGVHETISINDIIADRDGYILTYLSNENQEAVNMHWDDFTVVHGKTNVVSVQDYYPFGLTFNESVRVASTEQRFKYNGFEEQKEWGVLDYLARHYDPAIGRFINVDPAADLMRRHSPYNYAFDNPIRFIDPDGMMPDEKGKDEEKRREEQQQRMNDTEADYLTQSAGLIGGKVSLGKKENGDKKKKKSDDESESTDSNGSQSETERLEAQEEANPGVGIALRTIFMMGAEEVLLALGLSAVGSELERLTADETDRRWYHYTDAKGFAGILETGTIYPNSKGKVYLADDAYAASDAFIRLFAGQMTHKESGNYVFVFTLDRVQESNLTWDPNNPLEYTHYGPVKPVRILYEGPNPFGK